MSQDVRRWGIWRRFKDDSLMVVHGEYDMEQLGPCDTAIKVMPVTEHDRVVAELKAEIERLESVGKAAVQCMKDRDVIIDRLKAENDRLKRVIEKLREQRNTVIKAANQDGLEYGNPKNWDKELDAIAKGEA